MTEILDPFGIESLNLPVFQQPTIDHSSSGDDENSESTFSLSPLQPLSPTSGYSSDFGMNSNSTPENGVNQQNLLNNSLDPNIFFLLPTNQIQQLQQQQQQQQNILLQNPTNQSAFRDSVLPPIPIMNLNNPNEVRNLIPTHNVQQQPQQQPPQTYQPLPKHKNQKKKTFR